MKRCFFYGSLQRGGKWHHLLKKGAHFVSEAVIPANSGYRLFGLDWCKIPYLKRSAHEYTGPAIKGELWDLENDVFNAVENLEASYTRLAVNTDHGSAWTYVMVKDNYTGGVEIPDGDYKKWAGI